LTKLETRISELEQNKVKVVNYRDLASGTGDELVPIVQRVLGFLGIETHITDEGFPADLITEGKIAVEVTGISDKVDTDNDKMFQLLTFEEKYRKGEKMVLIANTNRRVEPLARKSKLDFTPQVEEHFRSHHVCAMTTLTLLELWIKADRDSSKIDEIRNSIFSTDGILKA
jgi:hypothetical protein